MGFDEDALLANNDTFEQFASEQGTYHPANGPDRLLIVIVDRSPPEPLEGMQGLVHNPIVITAKQAGNADDIEDRGILPSEIDDGHDAFTIPKVQGGTPERFRILKLLSDDGGATTFLLGGG